jgi:LPXTG-site transpeptidase (sortase) family protein
MTKRFLLLLVAVVLVGLTTRAFAAAFPDVRGTVYVAAFDYLSAKGVVQGYSDGYGRPGHPLNRAEALKVLYALKDSSRVERLRNSLPPIALFHDIDQRAWYAPYVEAAFQDRIVTGYPDGTFKPERYLTVEEAVAMLLRSHRVQGAGHAAELSPYIQNRDSEWFTPYINAAITKNLVMHVGRLELGQPITRGQFFDMVYRLDYSQKEGWIAYRGTEPQGGVVPVTRATAGTTTIGQIHVEQSASSSQYGSEKYFSISMPDLGINDLSVIHPSDPFTSEGVLEPLQNGVGHLFGYPGGGGKVMIYGHSSGYPWDVSQYTKIFRKVNQLEVGSRIYVTYEGKLHTYEVSHKQTIDAADTEPFRDDGSGEELILYTCWPPDSIAQRYLVHAIPVSSVALRK